MDPVNEGSVEQKSGLYGYYSILSPSQLSLELESKYPKGHLPHSYPVGQ